ncbi:MULTISPECIES: hypothetical protein [Vibrio]|uniref:hypothetical protein n=1 Tax=Vibrio TaxID=662 RepID=UPI0002DD5D11|nr:MULTISPECIES: hypothetical protein [Vibrio]MBB1462403.1 hypothetical protein [Vibrio sp. SG41-7]MDP2591243.1 hypothetical protein [Vibrio splendidus]OED82948.1 hypothetical protein A144_17320 [Vibrio splendidus ZF-90]OEE55125.1 hypothetical protein A146_18955 [Vibrio splendidus FF-500]OEF18347.1 hypothetical protein A145_20470 [Vibrio splendidus 5S-101]
MLNNKQNLVSHVKKQAKLLSKSEPDKCYNDCLNIIAKQLGYQDYHNILQKNKLSVEQAHPLESYSLYIKTVLLRSVDESQHYHDLSYEEPEFPESLYITQIERNNLPGIHKFSKEEIAEELFSLLFFQINTKSDLHKIEWLTRWAVYKDGIKDIGYNLLKSDKTNDCELGYLLVSLGHYYRSLMDNCSYKIGEHIDFKSYFGYWLHSVYSNDESNPTIKSLRLNFSVASPELINSATSWAPKWWLKQAGRI